MKSPIFFSLILLFALSMSCMRHSEQNSTVQATATPIKLPALLDRTEGVGTTEEQAHAKSRYTTITQEITQDPSAAKSYLKLAALFMWEARITGEHGHYYPASLEMVESALAHSPTNDEVFQALSYKASVLLSLHEFQRALEVAEKAVALNPHNAQIYGALVDAHVELGDYAKAVEMADKMVGIRPDLRSYSRVSYLREIHGEVEGAIEAMEMAATAGLPGTEEAAWARLTLGNLFARYDQPKKAFAEYDRILAERPDYPFAIAAKAELATAKGDYVEAEELLKEAIDLIPEVGFYHQLAVIYGKTGREKAQNELIKEILEMLADDEKAGHKMGLEYASLHLELTQDYQKALTYAQAEYKARPENIDVNKMLSKVYLKLNQPEDAQRHLSLAQVTRSQDPEIAQVASLLEN